MIIPAAIIAMALSLQPLQSPKVKGSAKSSSAQNAAAAEHTNKPQEPSGPPNTSSASQPSAERSKPSTDQDASDITVQRNIEIFTGVLAGVGVLQVIVMFLTLLVYCRQAREMRRQRHEMRQQLHAMLTSNETSRASLTIVERPFVTFPPELSISKVFDAATGSFFGWGIRIAIENTGNTPPRNLTSHTNITWPLDELGMDFSYPDFGPTGDVRLHISPKSKIFSSPMIISHDALKDVEDKKRRLYLYGWAKYYDRFPDTPLHQTRFCYEMISIKIGTETIEYLLAFHTGHNCADEECEEDQKAT